MLHASNQNQPVGRPGIYFVIFNHKHCGRPKRNTHFVQFVIHSKLSTSLDLGNMRTSNIKGTVGVIMQQLESVTVRTMMGC